MTKHPSNTTSQSNAKPIPKSLVSPLPVSIPKNPMSHGKSRISQVKERGKKKETRCLISLECKAHVSLQVRQREDGKYTAEQIYALLKAGKARVNNMFGTPGPSGYMKIEMVETLEVVGHVMYVEYTKVGPMESIWLDNRRLPEGEFLDPVNLSVQ